MESNSPIPDSQYRCFENIIRMYQLFGFLPEVPPTTLSRRIFYLTPWVLWCWFIISDLINLYKLLTSDLSVKGTEIFQRLLENLLAPLFTFEMYYFVKHNIKQVLEMRRSFDPDLEVAAACLAKERIILNVSAAMVISALFMSYYRRLFFGLEPLEVELVKYYYHKARPDRQLPYIMWFPFQADDTVAPLYYFSAVANVYLLVLTGVFAIHSNICILLFTIHLNGQFQILAKYLRNFGNPHLFVYKKVGGGVSRGNDLDTNVVRVVEMADDASQPSNRLEADNKESRSFGQMNEVSETVEDFGATSPEVTKIDIPRGNLDEPLHPSGATFKYKDLESEYRDNLLQALAMGRIFERDVIVFIIKRHQYLIRFRTQLEARLKILVVAKFPTYIGLTVGLYQLSFVSKFDINSVKLCFQFLYVLSISFVLTLASELLERGNESAMRAAYESNWMCELRSATSRRRNTHAPHGRRAEGIYARVLLILMCQRSIRLMYFGKTLELCNRAFVSVLRFCYSVLALMRQSIHVQSVQ